MAGRARVRFERRMRQDPELERMVWEVHGELAPLLEAPGVEPSRDLWPAIERRLDQGPAPARPGVSRWWRGLAVTSTGLAVLLAVALIVIRPVPEPPAPRPVAVLEDEAGANVLLVSLRAAGRRMELVPLTEAVEVPAGKSLEVWAVPRGEGGPVSLGLIRESPRKPVAMRMPAGLSREQVKAFAVSLEPPEGSPKPGPSGPILYQGALAAVDPGTGARG